MERPIKELLIILRDNIKQIKPNEGICYVIYSMMCDGVITRREQLILNRYLRDHKPANAFRREKMLTLSVDSNYWWTPGSVAPRLRWLNKQIDSL